MDAGAQVSLKDALDATPVGSHAYVLDVPGSHCYGFYAHGGFLTSVAQSAITAHFGSTLSKYDQPDTFDLQVNFLRFVTAGPVRVNVEDVKLGRTASTVRFALSQNGTDCVVGFASNLNMGKENGLSYPTSFALHKPPPNVNFKDLLSGSDPGWVQFVFPYSQESYLKGGTHLRWFTCVDGADDPSIIDFWFTPLADNETFTTEMLGSIADQWGCVSDNFHPEGIWKTPYMAAGTKIGDPAWGSDLSKRPVGLSTFSTSLQMTKRLPPEGVKWLFVRCQTKKIQNGRLHSEVLVFDQDMNLVVVGQQINFFAGGRRFAKKETKL